MPLSEGRSLAYTFFTCMALIGHAVYLVLETRTLLRVICGSCIAVSFVAQGFVFGRYKYSRRMKRKKGAIRILMCIIVALTHALLACMNGYLIWEMVHTFDANYSTAVIVGVSAVACQYLSYVSIFANASCVGSCVGKLFCGVLVSGTMCLIAWMVWKYLATMV